MRYTDPHYFTRQNNYSAEDHPRSSDAPAAASDLPATWTHPHRQHAGLRPLWMGYGQKFQILQHIKLRASLLTDPWGL